MFLPSQKFLASIFVESTNLCRDRQDWQCEGQNLCVEMKL